MKKSKQLLLLCAALLFLSACVAAGTVVGILVSREAAPEKIHYQVDIPWKEYTLEEAVKNSASIFVGKVSSKGDLQCQVVLYSSDTFPIYYRDVQVKVKQPVKGELENTALYRELGGETADAVYEFPGQPPVSKGKTYLFFLNAQGRLSFPGGLLPVENGMVSPIPDMLPAHLRDSEEPPSSLSLEEYLEAIAACEP